MDTADRLTTDDLSIGQIRMLVEKMGGIQTVLSFLEGQIFEFHKKWEQSEKGITFFVESKGITSGEWVERLGDNLSARMKKMLKRHLIPTSGVRTKICIMKNIPRGERSTFKVRQKAQSIDLLSPTLELFCLIMEKFSQTEISAMGVSSLVVMHNPIQDEGSGPFLFSTSGLIPEKKWNDIKGCYGFAFVVF